MRPTVYFFDFLEGRSMGTILLRLFPMQTAWKRLSLCFSAVLLKTNGCLSHPSGKTGFHETLEPRPPGKVPDQHREVGKR